MMNSCSLLLLTVLVRMHTSWTSASVLPSWQLPNGVTVVTSIYFVEGLEYPTNYEAELEILVPENHVVLLKITHLDLEGTFGEPCSYDFLEIGELNADNSPGSVVWQGCGQGSVPMQVLATSLYLRFMSDRSVTGKGFRLLYRMVPRSQEPEAVTQDVYNCSVPNYDLFKPLVACDDVSECADNEDHNCPELISTTSATGQRPPCQDVGCLTDAGPVPTTPPPPAPDGACGEAMCVNGSDIFIDGSLCLLLHVLEINATSTPTTVRVWPGHGQYAHCEWKVLVQKWHHALVTFDQINSTGGGQMYTWLLREGLRYQGVSLPQLLDANVTRMLQVDMDFHYSSENPPLTPTISFSLVLVANVLPSWPLPNGFIVVTSPGWGDFYPDDYEGGLEVHVPDDQVVLLKITYFSVEGTFEEPCSNDFLEIGELNADNSTGSVMWKGCGHGSVPMQVLATSIYLHFVSDTSVVARGFQLLYTTVPRSQEPESITQGVYNCSVPHYSLFEQLVACDKVAECADNEDEAGCPELTTTRMTTTERPCREVVCQEEPALFIVRTLSCLSHLTRSLNASRNVTTVHFIPDESSNENYARCSLFMYVPEGDTVHILFQQVEAGDFQITVDPVITVSGEQLKNGSITTTSTRSVLYLTFYSSQALDTPLVPVQFWTEETVLPATALSDTLGFVTSPNFGFNIYYPHHYNGSYVITVPTNSSVMLKVAFMSVYSSQNGCVDYVRIYEMDRYNDSQRLISKLCGYHQDFPIQTVHSPVRIRFTAFDSGGFEGFKIMYALVPTAQVPQVQEDLLYDCSGPQASLFLPLLACDVLQHCRGLEDETNCDYSGPACGQGEIFAGHKCYSIVRPQQHSTWFDANIECTNKQQTMATFLTPEDIDKWQEIAFEYDLRFLYLGLQLGGIAKIPAPQSALYRNMFMWTDGRAAFSAQVQNAYYAELKVTLPVCVFYRTGLDAVDCFEPRNADIVCEYDVSLNSSQSQTLSSVLEPPGADFRNLGMVSCPRGHVTRDFMSCDPASDCQAGSSPACQAKAATFPMFSCDNHMAIPFSLVCDSISQCPDNSDESFCQFRPCLPGLFRCQNQQCVRARDMCNGRLDCTDGSDEACELFVENTQLSMQPPAMVSMLGDGKFAINSTDYCPATHFRCLDGLCLPLYLRCNGLADCTRREDEADCHRYQCPGYYRCRASSVCLHPAQLCDGVFHCPHYDDEVLCQPLTCPDLCQCEGLAAICFSALPADFSCPQLRYLDLSHTSFSPSTVASCFHLVELRLSVVRLTAAPSLDLPNLKTLDLSDNNITAFNIQTFSRLTRLKVLVLRGNPLKTIFNLPLPGGSVSVWVGLHGGGDAGNRLALTHLDLSHTSLETFNGSDLAPFPLLTTLNVAQSKLHTISDDGFRSTPNLQQLDVKGSPLLFFPPGLLRDLSSLRTVHTDNFILCCQAMLPEGFDRAQCHAEEDLLTSCKDLLRTNVYRIFLWTFAVLAVVGNVGSFASRIYLGRKQRRMSSFNIFVANLCLSDLCMGVYLSIIGVADQVYLGQYLWHSYQWKTSGTCSLAGFLSLLSSEVSAFIICLITLDRLLVLRFPFSQHLHFRSRSAVVACAAAWVVGVVLAGVPLLPATRHWNFYSQTGICLPLPFSSAKDFDGHSYALGVMIALNLVLFVLIAAGQLVIYCSVRSNSMASSRDSASRQATLARRLTTIVVTDFLCWFPVGLLGLLGAMGVPIPGDVNVGVAIFVLPLNSALNPFLYTFNMLMERQRKALEDRLLRHLERSRPATSTISSAATGSMVAASSRKDPAPFNRDPVPVNTDPAKKDPCFLLQGSKDPSIAIKDPDSAARKSAPDSKNPTKDPFPVSKDPPVKDPALTNKDPDPATKDLNKDSDPVAKDPDPANKDPNPASKDPGPASKDPDPVRKDNDPSRKDPDPSRKEAILRELQVLLDSKQVTMEEMMSLVIR